MSKRRYWWLGCVVAVVALATSGVYVAWRAKNTYSVLRDWRAQIRHLAATGGTIGSAPASTTFSANYLEAVFGDEPELMNRLKDLIARGVAEDPTISLGDVTAMVVTYSKANDGKISDVVAHVLGSFSIGKRRPGFHRDGYFAAQIDPNLWNTGNTLLGLMGRDLLVFADPAQSHQHDELLESLLSGDISPLVDRMTNGYAVYFTAVFPEPKRVMPTQLRPHVQTCLVRGHLEPSHGDYEAVLLARENKSAAYTMTILGDLRLAGSLALKNQFDGHIKKREWGDHISTWWAYEMAKVMDAVKIEREQSTVSIKTYFDRPMVNASMKALERMGRDLTAMRLVMDEKLDPRIADKQLKSQKPMHYWSEEHRWGPDWPFAPTGSNSAPQAPSTTVAAPTQP